MGVSRGWLLGAAVTGGLGWLGVSRWAGTEPGLLETWAAIASISLSTGFLAWRFAQPPPTASSFEDDIPDSPIYTIVSGARTLAPLLKYTSLPFTTSLANIQAQLESAVGQADAEELNRVFAGGVDRVAELLGLLNAATLETLGSHDGRLRDLTVPSRAALIAACQSSGLVFRAPYAALVRALLLASGGADLALLKRLLDEGGTVHNLHKLIYADLPSPDRSPLLAHIQREAQAAVAVGGGAALGMKVVCDLDDTLYCSHAKNLSGIDTRFPQFCPYPGVFALLEELAHAHSETAVPGSSEGGTAALADEPPPGLPGVAFLWARPHAYSDWVEAAIYRYLHGLYRTKRFAVMPTVLPGSLSAGFQALSRGIAARGNRAALIRAWGPVADFKHQRFLEYAALYPEYRFLLIGDNGQGDLSVGERLVRASAEAAASGDARGGPTMVCVLLHRVQASEYTYSNYADLPLKERQKRWERDKVLFFRTYVHAALLLARMEVLPLRSLRRVWEEAWKDFREITDDASEIPHSHREYERLLRRDTAAAEQHLAACEASNPSERQA
ncbi:hypothetical protein KFL_004510070 [Klebsormidium nitens]|uniref:Phosphatidate phosphatase APP1 catalytic domain-containing protein n=1 Tax=Klebsormidium nitens TaxID=105231 RepID=A0A1Y1ICN1_KLENI|nr:hypothetical protein KFL_004510070 [Klebsormidium nitens]|eukprot:GAQ88680.1 hypothetical protein KFL_004510070 [Klebsormidium nitens]